MSFSVDLWNGFEVIKTQIFSVQKKIKTISKAISTYLTIDGAYNKNLENLYKEFKEINNSEYMLDKSYIKILDIFEYENQNRKILSSFITQLIIEPLNEYLRQPNLLLNKCLNDNAGNEESFKKSLNILKEKQSNYFKDCKELSVLLAQNEMDEINNTNFSKVSKSRISRINDKFFKLNQSKQEYLNSINESNKERENYNQKTEEMLNTLETIYKTMLEKLKDTLTNFATQRNEFLQKIYTKEKNEFETIHTKVDTKKEFFQFVCNNATKEFPMRKFEFCPMKYSALNQNIKNKCNKFPENAFPKIYKAVKNYFEENKVFKEETQFRINRRNTDFLGIFSKKALSENISGISKRDKKQNKEFIEKYITDLLMNKATENKENNINKNNNIYKKEDNTKQMKDNIDSNNKQKQNDDIKDKLKENNKNIINEKESESKKSEENNTKDNNNIEENKDKHEKNEEKKGNENFSDINLEKKESKEIKEVNHSKKDDEKNSISSEDSENEEKASDNIQDYFCPGHPNYLSNAETLIKKLSFLRSKGAFTINENAYNQILSLFFNILNQEPKNSYFLKNILILSQTFYKISDNKKIYLQQGLKGMRTFMNPEVWHRVINYSMNLSCSSMDLSQTKEEMIEKINKQADVIIVAYLCDIKQYTNDENVFNDVKNFYVKVYNLNEDSINNEVEKYMNSLKRNETFAKENHIKIEEKSKNEDDIENESNENNINNDENNNFLKQRRFSTPINILHNNNCSIDNKLIQIKNKNKINNIINEDIEKENVNEPKEDYNQTGKNEITKINNNIIDKSENRNQIINNNINIIKIEAKEVIIVENKTNKNINIEEIKALKKDEKKDIKGDNIKLDDKKDSDNNNNNDIKKKVEKEEK